MLWSADYARILSEDPGDVLKRIWQVVAACARYGRQRIPDLMEMPAADVRAFRRELRFLIEHEEKSAKGSLLGPEQGEG